jgi:hypothetical protein
MDFISAPFM